MKTFKELALTMLAATVLVLGYNFYTSLNTTKISVHTDMNLSNHPELKGIVFQEELDRIGFESWDIDEFEKYPEKNQTLKPLRQYLKDKDTNKVLNFLKDNNLSVDVRLQYNTTPLMYSSFYNDLNTSKELIKLGANIRAKDRYSLAPLAYAISHNSIDVVKLLIDNGVKFEEVPRVQGYLISPEYKGSIGSIIIDKDTLTINYDLYIGEKYYSTRNNSETGEPFKDYWSGKVNLFYYVVRRNFIEIAKLILESGYKPDCKFDNTLGKNCFKELTKMPNYEPMLELMLEHNVSGQPNEEELKKAYDHCLFLHEHGWNEKELNKDEKLFFDDLHIKFLNKTCSDRNSTFKNTKEYIKFKNQNTLMIELTNIGADEFERNLSKKINKNKKVIYKNQTDTIYNKINHIEHKLKNKE
ncbi:ankyrin domain-containing protein [Campylobacter blaseri]|uniref:ankyrin repeat domain-containing protein n=1 Tax=Campylobacter blaseri TaxID=2042961 RepID=UPI001056EA11|nr:ankyrin repeat domain-containing protein [Campylobacter blaseri]QKF86254.1 ankyrin domain-containing protein [Campylobacter blaseri]QKF86568.1 ankyrin domain-containing protein [Campylobacter blaseri]